MVQDTEKTARPSAQALRHRVVLPVPEGPETTINRPSRDEVGAIMPCRLAASLDRANRFRKSGRRTATEVGEGLASSRRLQATYHEPLLGFSFCSRLSLCPWR